jgi:hypothetical protein
MAESQEQVAVDDGANWKPIFYVSRCCGAQAEQHEHRIRYWRCSKCKRGTFSVSLYFDPMTTAERDECEGRVESSRV